MWPTSLLNGDDLSVFVRDSSLSCGLLRRKVRCHRSLGTLGVDVAQIVEVCKTRQRCKVSSAG
jgi:hypothetical protein